MAGLGAGADAELGAPVSVVSGRPAHYAPNPTQLDEAPWTFAERARATLTARGMDLARLSIATDIDERRLRRLINQPAYYVHGPTLGEVVRVAQALRVEPAWLAGWAR